MHTPPEQVSPEEHAGFVPQKQDPPVQVSVVTEHAGFVPQKQDPPVQVSVVIEHAGFVPQKQDPPVQVSVVPLHALVQLPQWDLSVFLFVQVIPQQFGVGA